MAGARQDLQIAVRSLAKTPASTAIALCTLALAIGANTAIFTLLNAVVLRSLPVPHPEQLLALSTTIPDSINGDQPFSLAMFNEISRRQQVFSDVFAWNGGGINTFEVKGRYVTAAFAEVSGTYYRGMQIAPLLGRFIEPGDVTQGSGRSNNVAVISYRAWRAWYQGDANIIGKTIRIGDRHPFTIIGVEPEGFSGLIIDGSSDVTIPILSTRQAGTSDVHDPRILWLRLFGRVRPTLSVTQATQEMKLLWPRILDATPPPGYEGEKRARFFARRIKIESAATGVSFLRNRFARPLQVLLTLVAAVLLIACLNLANLTLAKAAARNHESAVRSALGASAWELVRPALLENLLLSCTSAAVGLALAVWGSRALLKIAWTGLINTALTTSLDWRVLSFTAAVAIAAGILFSVPPAVHAFNADAIEALRQQSRSVRSGVTSVGKGLLVTQVAVSLVLVTGALLFSRTLYRLHTLDVGYRRDHLLTLMLFPQPGRRATPNTVEYYRQLAEKLTAIPGVESVSYSGSGPGNQLEDFEPVCAALNAPLVQVVHDVAGPAFFRTMRMQIFAGREFDWRDGENTAILSQSLAKKLYPGENPIGRIIWVGSRAHAQAHKIVGVVNSARLWKIESPSPLAVYLPLSSMFVDEEPLVDIRTTVDPRSLKTETEHAVRAMGHQFSLRTMTLGERLDSYLSVQRLTALLASFFGGLALLISAIGLYGLVSFQVSRRTSELGVRFALGAQRAQVIIRVLRDGLILALIGCVFGVAASIFAARFARSLLFGVSESDPVSLTASVTVLLITAALAAWLPAKRAANLDPASALRVE